MHIKELHSTGNHKVKERAIRTYIPNRVLERAIQFGYQIMAVNEAWCWDETAPIFRQMMGNLMVDKFLATKFSKMNMDQMSDEERDAFTQEFFDVFDMPVCFA